MRGLKVTSAVAGVGSSRKGNTTVNGWLEYTSLRTTYVKKAPPDYQVYVSIPPYHYSDLPMKNTCSLGAVWFSRRFTKPSYKQVKSNNDCKWNHIRYRAALGQPA